MNARILTVGALSLGLVACGGIGSKEDAAKAMARVGEAGSAASSGAGQALMQGITTDVEMSVAGKTGTAKVKLVADGNDGDATVTQQITFSNYSADGENTFDGTMTYTFKFSSTNGAGGGSAEIGMKGKVTMSGEYDSELEMDITQKSSTQIAAGAVSVNVTLQGYVLADGQRYEFANETFAVARTSD